jgi:hypothetical protein
VDHIYQINGEIVHGLAWSLVSSLYPIEIYVTFLFSISILGLLILEFKH